MAASASLFSVGKAILEKLGPLLQQELALVWNLRSELEKLEGTVSAIQALLLDAEEQQEHSHQVKDWLEKLTVLLYDAEDLLDDFATEALRNKAASRDDNDFNCRIRCSTAVCFLFSLPKWLLYGLSMAHKVKSLREQLDAISADKIALGLNPRFEEKGKMRNHNQTISSVPDLVVGREDDVRQIKELLLASSENSVNAVSVVSIVGIGGMGKTTLAQLIYNDREVREEFKLRLWVCVSESFEVNVIVQKILESATGGKEKNLELNTLANHLKGQIGGKKYLLVLDDVWNFDPEKWQVLRSVLRCGAAGTKILVTTRFENFAMMMSRSTPPYALRGLSSPQSWSLFRQVVCDGDQQAGQGEPENINNVEQIKRLIMKKSAGVPLAVRTIGTLLYFKDSQTEWLPFLMSNELLGAEEKNSVLHNLKLSYDYLPSNLKHCFALCSLFPKDHVIRVRPLIRLWVSVGLIKSPPNDSKKSFHDLGLDVFMDLAWRSFFQEIKRDYSNSIKTCKMHDLIHDLAVSVAGSSCKQLADPADEASGKTYHMSLNHDFWSPSELVGHLDKTIRLRTFFVCYAKWYQSGTSWNESSFKNFVSKLGSLRALDFVNSGMEMVPYHIQGLKHLRYLDLSNNHKMAKLPDSITMLQNLEVLILVACQLLQELPKDINKLVNLWYLDCRECFALTHMPLGLGELTRLQTLTCFVVGKDSLSSKRIGGLHELARLHSLRGYLEIVNLRHLRDTMALSPLLAFEIGASSNLKGKLHLEQLLLQWDDGNFDKDTDEWDECLKGSEGVECDERLLESLKPHSNLRALTVSGYKGRNSPSWISSLTNLVTIQFGWCKVRHGLHYLHGLPSLKRLDFCSLSELEYIDEDEDHDQAMNAGTGKSSNPFFPSLEKLYLLDCPKLKGWQGKPPQFPKLSKLVIQYCPQLTSMPLFPTLDKKLQLVNTSLQPLLSTMSISPVVVVSVSSHSSLPSSSNGLNIEFPLAKLKKLEIDSIVHHLPKDWLQGMQHLRSLQEIAIEDCSGLEDTLDWHNISHVASILIDHTYINRDGKSLWDEDHWNNFPRILQAISEE